MPRSRPTITRRRFTGAALASALLPRLAHAQGAPAAVLERGPEDRAEVALTFDCGSDAGHTADILDTLAAGGILATFGVTGAFADALPDLVRRMVDEGHALMNHSYDHPSFTGANTADAVLTTEARLDQLQRTEDALLAACGRGGKPLFRPPYGDIDDGVLADLGAAGFTHAVMWTLDVMGWAGWSPQAMLDRVAANHGNGYIYLMHVGGQSQEGPTLPGFIDLLRAQGYGFTRIPEMIGQGSMPGPAGGPTRLRVLDRQNLRSGLGLVAAPFAVLSPGTVVTILSGPRFLDGYTWYEVSTPYGTGWIAADFAEPADDWPTPPRPALAPARNPD